MHKGNFLKHLIKDKGFTQGSLAKKLNTTQGYISKVLATEEPTNKVIKSICDIIGVGLQEFNDGLIEFVPENNTGDNELSQNPMLEFKLKYLEEKAQWLNEKESLVDDKKNLQDEIVRLQQELAELKRLSSERKVG